MRWRMALAALSLTVAVACGAGHLTAQETEDGLDDGVDGDVEPAKSPPSRWAMLLDPVWSKKPAFDFLTGGMPDRLIEFGGIDIWRYGIGTYAGAQFAPAGINKAGFVVRFIGSQNIERYRTRTNDFRTEVIRAAILPGYKFTADRVELQLLGGLDVENDYLMVNRHYFASRGRIGARFTIDGWWEPTRLLMLNASLSGTTIDNGISSRAAAGWRLFDQFWIGPEASISSDFFSQQYRIGAHLTGLRTGNVEWTIAAGHIEDSFKRDGVYARVGLMIRPPREPFFVN